jgi:hypothetical protein
MRLVERFVVPGLPPRRWCSGERAARSTPAWQPLVDLGVGVGEALVSTRSGGTPLSVPRRLGYTRSGHPLGWGTEQCTVGLAPT